MKLREEIEHAVRLGDEERQALHASRAALLPRRPVEKHPAGTVELIGGW